MKRALITGITGQDGSYLAELLLKKGYQVHGMIRRSSSFNTGRIDHIYDDVHLHYGDLTDSSNINRLLDLTNPDEIYNLAAQSVSKDSLCPILGSTEMKYRTLENLWDELVKKGNKIITTDDPEHPELEIEVIEMPNNKQIRALGYWNGMGTWFPIKQLSRHRYKGQICQMTQKFGHIEVTPNHSILDVNQNVCLPAENPWLLNVRKLNHNPNTKHEIKLTIDGRFESDANWMWSTKDKGAYGKIKKILSGEDLQNFCEFIGAFVSEGHTTYNKANGNYYIGISQQDRGWLEDLEQKLSSFYDGNFCYVRHKKEGFADVWELQLKSNIFYKWLRKHCGEKSQTKKLPDWWFNLETSNKQKMFNKLLEGDGSTDERKTTDDQWRYVTSSYHLACQMSMLATCLGDDYTVNYNQESKVWNLRQCRSYQPSQGEVGRKVTMIDYDDYVYDISVDEVSNFAVGVGNIVVHNSHVQVSFEVPEYTANTDGVGTLRLLDGIKEVYGIDDNGCRLYQASTSELYGKVQEIPQTETTPFYPRSPYAAAKLYAYWVTVNYREAYGLHASNGILFNHETIAEFMPMFVRQKGNEDFDIKPIGEIVHFDQNNKKYQSKSVSGLQVWGKNGWVDVSHASAYPHDIKGDNKNPRFVNARNAAFMATGSHVAFLEDGSEKETKDLEVKDKLETIQLPVNENKNHLTENEAELLGLMVADGYIISEKGGNHQFRFINSNKELRNRATQLWKSITDGAGTTYYYPSKSGFDSEKTVGHIDFRGSGGELNWFRQFDFYTKDRKKRVPKQVLNSSSDIMLAFLRGYNAGDGLKKNLCTYEFKNFKTNSATLAMGLWYLIDKTTGQDINLTIEKNKRENGSKFYYSLNLLSPTSSQKKIETVKTLLNKGYSQRKIQRETGISRGFVRKVQKGYNKTPKHHMRRCSNEIKKIMEWDDYDGWFYDLETSSGEFHCGIGATHVHNSPRRGDTFVTKKITNAIKKIKRGEQEFLFLGNLDSIRDWGYAPEYMDAAWRMLQQEEPDDYVIATGEIATVRQFVEECCRLADINIKWIGKGVDEVGISLDDKHTVIRIDPKYFRPTEVDYLQGDYSKAKKKLEWEPKVKWKELARIMMQ